MQESIKTIFTESIQAQIAAGEVLPSSLEAAAFTIVQSLINGNKVVCCGVPSCHMLATHMAGLLVNFYETERPCLPAVALTQNSINLGTVSTEDDTEHYARQVRAFAQQGDLLLVIGVNGNEKSIVSAAEAALTKDMKVIALIGDDGGELTGLLGPNDVEIRVPSKRPSRIIESHLFSLHCLSQLIDDTLFPQEEQ
ncbi:SIS domain-containing protein [Pseudoalteromonas aurantia]|uniref:DnaA initiator-associating protein DiaA n=1 Tax=Pseudoalteromonas aurantia TaxID=43654 RepID=A0A5S3V7I0_9GAMM|nr:SIS domain-containing protein [Pseudoalteromonas aurantia]TMO64072.1 DnaA initiator-associating protein DiaA [Pseudoalteromonas aurantia]TMO66838.1 DnaA initiator-associating protein DiaA [Pseudoalteromonas aurantia]TMO78721.1 DnaA initiator-associating protein DiaA [Pseudoalteromonas aurantia]